MISHTGTETRARLLREAAVGILVQWTESLNQPCRVKDECPMVVNFFYPGEKDLSGADGTLRISTG